MLLNKDSWRKHQLYKSMNCRGISASTSLASPSLAVRGSPPPAPRNLLNGTNWTMSRAARRPPDCSGTVSASSTSIAEKSALPIPTMITDMGSTDASTRTCQHHEGEMLMSNISTRCLHTTKVSETARMAGDAGLPTAGWWWASEGDVQGPVQGWLVYDWNWLDLGLPGPGGGSRQSKLDANYDGVWNPTGPLGWLEQVLWGDCGVRLLQLAGSLCLVPNRRVADG
ncbi:hypothetical protein PR048_001694 [Dryococelus australis]|uniref:Uncharacterized protein n=1 Tax=Dryococelus australis TaxID=614101 RepID=A0ABQ9IJH9_9NEOP|nr:hypothetical protein PR048_001694 [Dryococelus australis]